MTGVSRGVGLATARSLLLEGATVFGVARDVERLERARVELAASAPGRFHSLAVDLADVGSDRKISEWVSSLTPALDVVIQNAGIMVAHAEEISHEPVGALERSLDVNLLAPFRLTRALLPLLLAGQEPRLLNVSSGAGTHAGMTEPGIASYRLSKWALNGLTLLQAKEFQGKISVNALDPGWVKTDLGGDRAPGVPEESAQSVVETLLLPWSHTGKFYKNAEEILW